ncbi:MAG TPA: flagellar basal body L-ring protein FlgH [Bacteriovoracaceae bacterium]|nr:flagellar basal body L-ring protein FlgH [Bacteriovoracaceae bacterium]
MNIIIMSLMLTLVSCANFMANMHKQMDREEKRGQQRARVKEKAPDRYEPYRSRFHAENDKRPIKDPMTYSLGSGPSGQMRPPVKRDYRPQRYKADDFKDNDNDGSLWVNQGSSSSLFTYQNDKRTGDMVIINVLENLRNQISSELKRTFPDKPVKKTAADEKTKKGEDKVKTIAAAPAAPKDEEMDMKVYDKVSGTVMEEISKDYIILRGRKEVIFKKEKRSIEIQALVSRKDIMENDYVNSDKLLESKVFIVKEQE